MWHSTKHIWLLLYKSGLYGIDTFLISSQQIWNVRSQTGSDQTISDCIVRRGRKTNFSGQGQKCKEFLSSPIECIRVLFSQQAVVMLWWQNAWQKGLPVSLYSTMHCEESPLAISHSCLHNSCQHRCHCESNIRCPVLRDILSNWNWV